ncbi:MAG: sugar-transfer associated ATP-grasp domain-containing protein [Cytophagales bacterium]|nr:sugar-transfer associated ATP-grasp domain-containing protein [Cytophagales bacterium]
MNERNLGLIYPHNDRKDYKYADDKYLAKSILEKNGLPCPKTYAVVNSIGQIEKSWNSVRHHRELVIKPAKGAGGKGIMILTRSNDTWISQGKVITDEEIFFHVANVIFGIYSFGDSDVALIEEFIRPHKLFLKIYPNGVPDIRIILLKGVPLMAMLRMPTKESGGKANLHQGGLGIGVDMESGKLLDAFDGQKYLNVHPDTGHSITGQTLPHWQELIVMSIEASKYFPLEYLGVDLVIDAEKGPMIMELNVRPGLAIQLANRKGLKAVITENKKAFDQ